MLLPAFVVVVVVCGGARGGRPQQPAPDVSASAGDRSEERAERVSNLQLLVPMVAVDDSTPPAARAGHLASDSSEENEESVANALDTLAELLQGAAPPALPKRPARPTHSHTHKHAYSPRRPRARPAPASAEHREPCPACMILYALKALQLNQEQENRSGRAWNKRGSELASEDRERGEEREGEGEGRAHTHESCPLCIVEMARARRRANYPQDVALSELQRSHDNKPIP